MTAHLLYPQTRTPGMMKTGIWRPGWHRPARYDRPGAPPAETGRDGLPALLERAKAAGQEITFAPLSEVADLCFEGLQNDVFWISPARLRGGRAGPRAVAGHPLGARLPAARARSSPAATRRTDVRGVDRLACENGCRAV